MRAKAKKTPMCSASLFAIELKGLAAPREAPKNLLGKKVVLASGGKTLDFRDQKS